MEETKNYFVVNVYYIQVTERKNKIVRTKDLLNIFQRFN